MRKVPRQASLVGEVPPRAASLILALGRMCRGAHADDLAFYEAADLEQFADWTRRGVANWPTARLDRRGLVLMMRLADAEAARAALGQLPSVASGIITFDIVPLRPFCTWAE